MNKYSKYNYKSLDYEVIFHDLERFTCVSVQYSKDDEQCTLLGPLEY